MPLIVILDDRVTNRNIFSRLASSLDEGVTVRAFGDPLEALDWVDTNPPDLVVTDYKMPGLDGAQFTRRFRDKPNCVDVPVVVITAYADRNFRLRALEAGATDFLQSPVDHHEFVTRARNLLKLRMQQQIIKSRARSLEEKLESSERSREELLRDSREALAQVIDTVPAMISAFDRQGRCVFVNAYQAALAGSSPAELAGRDVGSLFGREQGERSRLLDQLVFETGQALPSFEEEINDQDGLQHVFLTTKSPLRDGINKVIGVLTTSLDITDRKMAESHLRHMAHHDSLTDLPNRILLRERLQRELARGRRGDRLFALHFLDLDRFKAVNDALGHHLGDRLLQQVTRRLGDVVRTEDTVARLGGDEFAILQTDVVAQDEASGLASRIIEALSRPFMCEGHEISISASIGITVHPRDGGDVDELLRNADLAMYRAKSEGRNGYRFYAADMDVHSRETMQLEADLRNALGGDQFVLHYQPQVNLRSGRIVGAEALLRWNRPGWGLLRPGEFLPLAEENGLIVAINTWVLRAACAQAAEWARSGLGSLRVGVNLSPIQFRKQNVYDLVLQALAETKLDPGLLELELTEGHPDARSARRGPQSCSGCARSVCAFPSMISAPATRRSATCATSRSTG